MISHPNNRPHFVDGAAGDFLYSLYELLFKSHGLPLRVKQRTFETAADSKHSWRVVSISEAAAKHILSTGSATGLQRGHIVSRAERGKTLFERSAPLSRNELLSYFFEHDTVALVTKAENAKGGAAHWSTLYEVPEGLFDVGSFRIYARKRKEIKWVQEAFRKIR